MPFMKPQILILSCTLWLAACTPSSVVKTYPNVSGVWYLGNECYAIGVKNKSGELVHIDMSQNPHANDTANLIYDVPPDKPMWATVTTKIGWRVSRVFDIHIHNSKEIR
jgi:hypothetical protein